MAGVIRLVCPECDAVHRVKSVTLGKLYRCKKCRSGLITMQPAILACPNCGATTPPTHIEASKLITCEECEKAPLMEVRLPGMEYPSPSSSDENVEIVSKMSIPSGAEEQKNSGAESEEAYDNAAEEDNAEVEQNVVEAEAYDYSAENDNESKPMNETTIFKADTNFIVKNQIKAGGVHEGDTGGDNQPPEQLSIFEDSDNTDSEVTESFEQEDSEVYDSKPDSEESEIYSESIDDSEEVMPEFDIVHRDEGDSDIEFPEPVDKVNNVVAEPVITVEQKPQKKKSGGWSWSLPAWVPAVFALLLVGLYGMLYADLESMRIQLEKSQENIISQDQAFQEERKKYITLIRSTQDENRKLRNDIMELRSDNNVLRKKSISLEIPEIQD